MNRTTVPRQNRLDVPAALHAICSTGKGCCWYCDARLPAEAEAIRSGWDVQRVDDHPVASIILVCPVCLPRQCESSEGRERLDCLPLAAISSPRRGRSRRVAT
ncbi:MAG: hypothetical protein KGM47_03590 [Acidobacteriota bacterium]|nr:hypothetical protein [Acidobacteriota bacterium]